MNQKLSKYQPSHFLKSNLLASLLVLTIAQANAMDPEDHKEFDKFARRAPEGNFSSEEDHSDSDSTDENYADILIFCALNDEPVKIEEMHIRQFEQTFLKNTLTDVRVDSFAWKEEECEKPVICQIMWQYMVYRIKSSHRSGKLEQAIKLSNKALEIKHISECLKSGIHYLMGQSFFGLEHHGEAIKHFEYCLSHLPEHLITTSPILFFKGLAHLSQGHDAKTVDYESGTTRPSYHTKGSTNSSSAPEEAHVHFLKAFKCLRNFLPYAPSGNEKYFLISKLIETCGELLIGRLVSIHNDLDYEKLLEDTIDTCKKCSSDLRKLLQKKNLIKVSDALWSEIYLVRGIACHKLGRNQEAFQCVRTAIDHCNIQKDQMRFALPILFASSTNLEDYDCVIKVCDRLLQSCDTDEKERGDYLFYKGLTYDKKGDKKQALDCLEEASKYKPEAKKYQEAIKHQLSETDYRLQQKLHLILSTLPSNRKKKMNKDSLENLKEHCIEFLHLAQTLNTEVRSLDMLLVYVVLADTYLQLGEVSKSMDFYAKALEYEEISEEQEFATLMKMCEFDTANVERTIRTCERLLNQFSSRLTKFQRGEVLLAKVLAHIKTRDWFNGLQCLKFIEACNVGLPLQIIDDLKNFKIQASRELRALCTTIDRLYKEWQNHHTRTQK